MIIKLAESISPITKNLSEGKDSTHKLGEIIKENNTPQLPLENTGKELLIQNEQIHPDVIYDTSLENTLSNMQKQKKKIF